MAVENDPSAPLARCRVLYLGSAIPLETSVGLEAIQKPLSERYPAERNTKVNGIDSNLSVFNAGLHLQYRADSGQLTWFPIQNLYVCAAVRCVYVQNAVTGERSARFVSLDSPVANDPHVKHPPMFACIMRRTTGVKILECHAFICKSSHAAMALVRACMDAYENKSGWQETADHLPSTSVLQHTVPHAGTAASRPQQVQSASRPTSGSAASTRTRPGETSKSAGRLFDDHSQLARPYNLVLSKNGDHENQAAPKQQQLLRIRPRSVPPGGFVEHIEQPLLMGPMGPVYAGDPMQPIPVYRRRFRAAQGPPPVVRRPLPIVRRVVSPSGLYPIQGLYTQPTGLYPVSASAIGGQPFLRVPSASRRPAVRNSRRRRGSDAVSLPAQPLHYRSLSSLNALAVPSLVGPQPLVGAPIVGAGGRYPPRPRSEAGILTPSESGSLLLWDPAAPSNGWQMAAPSPFERPPSRMSRFSRRDQYDKMKGQEDVSLPNGYANVSQHSSERLGPPITRLSKAERRSARQDKPKNKGPKHLHNGEATAEELQPQEVFMRAPVVGVVGGGPVRLPRDWYNENERQLPNERAFSHSIRNQRQRVHQPDSFPTAYDINRDNASSASAADSPALNGLVNSSNGTHTKRTAGESAAASRKH